ncbi:MFS transporter [Marinithermus hydrothermalis]|uniref:Major facilitator superfamily MFS_1 n=1 Tax=Marinithermus hydrothermalis (strain DSM 14884 / JCM 11576 / T1) TaxID=869210 RepID=F2NN58_MARHT|nr:MFS transporter [Marinithermus hydrothermalis]AEB12797.1 major facilitator superfamily MFS_1 [Marinithermus hydrothermalis DSM 14884]
MGPLALLFLSLFNSILGLSVLFPILAPLARELGLSEVQVGLFSTGYALMQFVMSPYWGRQSERVGRKPVLLVGILGFALSFYLFAIVAQLGFAGRLGPGVLFGLLLAARVLGGTFSSATLPTAQAYVADVTGRNERTAGMALIGAAFGLGVIFGPAIGAGLAGISLLAPIYFSASLALLNAWFVWWKLPEPQRRVGAEAAGALRPTDPRIQPLLVLGFAVSLASVALEQTVAFYFQDRLGLDATGTARAVGTALVVYGLVAVFVQGVLVRKYQWPPRVLLWVGVPAALAGFVLFIFAHGFAVLTLALVLQGFGQGLAMPGVTAALSLAVGEGEQGSVAGLGSAAQALGRMLGPVAGTGLYEFRPEYPYVFSASLLGLALFLLAVNPRVRQALEEHPGA